MRTCHGNKSMSPSSGSVELKHVRGSGVKGWLLVVAVVAVAGAALAVAGVAVEVVGEDVAGPEEGWSGVHADCR